MEGQIKLVSKELNPFGAITAFFRDWAPRTLTGGAERKVYAQRISVLGAQSQKITAIAPK